MAAPTGNRNAAKGKRWHDALHKALARYADKNLKIKAGEALDRIAAVVVENAIKGDRDSITEIANRLDGKPMQPVEMDATLRECRIDDTPLTTEEWDATYGRGSAPG
jgi:hypothetical protein